MPCGAMSGRATTSSRACSSLEGSIGENRRKAVAGVRARLERGKFVLAVVGEFSSGKSFLLNALLGKFRYEEGPAGPRIVGLLATDINPSTATITELEAGKRTTRRPRSSKTAAANAFRSTRSIASSRSEPTAPARSTTQPKSSTRGRVRRG